MDAIDRLDGRRHDSMVIVDAANEFSRPTDFGQDEIEGGLRTHAGLDEAEHPLTSLLRESHNATCVVRDLVT